MSEVSGLCWREDDMYSKENVMPRLSVALSPPPTGLIGPDSRCVLHSCEMEHVTGT